MKPQLTELISPQAIHKKIKEVARRLEVDYIGKRPVIVMVLKGSICLVADLIRELEIPVDIEAISCSSYGARGTERGELRISGLERLSLKGRDVLLVDDIYDSGHTLSTVHDAILQMEPASIKSLVLLVKNVPHITNYRPDYALFEVDNLFVVGYGLDYKELYRGLPGICVYKDK
jgi:hypoxanthine phosphoribosyltransferase